MSCEQVVLRIKAAPSPWLVLPRLEKHRIRSGEQQAGLRVRCAVVEHHTKDDHLLNIPPPIPTTLFSLLLRDLLLHIHLRHLSRHGQSPSLESLSTSRTSFPLRLRNSRWTTLRSRPRLMLYMGLLLGAHPLLAPTEDFPIPHRLQNRPLPSEAIHTVSRKTVYQSPHTSRSQRQVLLRTQPTMLKDSMCQTRPVDP